jgi:hypothetical protein
LKTTRSPTKQNSRLALVRFFVSIATIQLTQVQNANSEDEELGKDSPPELSTPKPVKKRKIRTSILETPKASTLPIITHAKPYKLTLKSSEQEDYCTRMVGIDLNLIQQ